MAIAVAALVLAWPASAGAGGDPPPPTTGVQPQPQFELVSMDQSSLPPGGTVTLALAVDANLAADAHINVVAHQAVDGRIRYERNLTGEDLRSVADQVAFPLAALQRAAGVVLLPVGLQDPAAPADPSRLSLSETGVYPLEVELNDADDDTLAEFVLPLVVTAPNPDGTPIVGERLRVAWVWPLTAAPAIQPFGEPDPDVVAALNPNGRLGRQAAALAAAPDIPFTVAPGPETLDAWTLLAANDPTLDAGLTAMEETLDTNQVLAGPYVPLNVPSLVANGFRDEVGVELARGTEALSDRLASRVDPRTALTAPVNNDALTYLRGANVDRMVVNGEALVPIDSQYTPAQPFTLQSQTGTTTVAATDPALNAMLTADASPALRAQQLLAGLSVVALELPNATRGIVLANPVDWDAPTELIDAAIRGLRGNQLLQPVDIDQFIAQVPLASNEDDIPVVRQLQPYVPPPPPVTPQAYAGAQDELNALRSLIGPADPRILAGERALLTSLTSAWESAGGRARARSELGVIGAASNEVLSQIRVPAGSTVTLTARKGEIPVTFLNETDRTLRVKVRLESDELFFPDGAVREIELPPRNTTFGFTVESRASGTFPLDLTVTSVDEVLVIQSTRVRVRSTFVSGVGVFITVGAALFLAGWWLLHFRRRRRRPLAAAA